MSILEDSIDDTLPDLDVSDLPDPDLAGANSDAPLEGSESAPAADAAIVSNSTPRENFQFDGKGNVTGYSDATDSAIYVPDKDDQGNAITGIAIGAFRDCKELKTFTLPSTVKTIGDEAFYGCAKWSSAQSVKTR